MVYTDTLFRYSYCIITFAVNTQDYNKQLGSIISQNDKHIEFFSRKLIQTQREYTITEK